MCISEDELDLLRHGLRIMLNRKEVAADVFYTNLFDIAPQTRSMFSDDIVGQTEKVMFAFGAVVGQIHDLEACRAMTRDLAIRHVSYGVVPAHYALTRVAVMRTLEMVLETEFTPEMDTAWQKAYDAIADAMIGSAYPSDIAAQALRGAPTVTQAARGAA